MSNKATIELKKAFAVPASVLFRAIQDGQLLKATGVKPDSFKHEFHIGGEFSLEWTSETAGSCKGRYLQIVPEERVQFTWHSTGCNSGTQSDTVVTVTLLPDGKNCQMLLKHEGLDSGFCYEDHLAGWTSSIDDFQAALQSTIGIA